MNDIEKACLGLALACARTYSISMAVAWQHHLSSLQVLPADDQKCLGGSSSQERVLSDVTTDCSAYVTICQVSCKVYHCHSSAAAVKPNHSYVGPQMYST